MLSYDGPEFEERNRATIEELLAWLRDEGYTRDAEGYWRDAMEEFVIVIKDEDNATVIISHAAELYDGADQWRVEVCNAPMTIILAAIKAQQAED